MCSSDLKTQISNFFPQPRPNKITNHKQNKKSPITNKHNVGEQGRQKGWVDELHGFPSQVPNIHEQALRSMTWVWGRWRRGSEADRRLGTAGGSMTSSFDSGDVEDESSWQRWMRKLERPELRGVSLREMSFRDEMRVNERERERHSVIKEWKKQKEQVVKF